MPSTEPNRADVRSAWLVSLLSVVWTVLAGGVAIALGVTHHSAVLVAFGAIGFVDAAGSVALVYHFRHGLRHDALSDRLEKIAHRVVLIGLFLVGLSAVCVGSIRLVTGASGGQSGAGTVLAATSLVVLAVLSAIKQRLARRVASNALLSDGHLSGVGAMQAGVALFGTGASSWFGWTWADALAATIVGLVAIAVAVTTMNAERRALGTRM
jgi:divalent metal cation (Fe/Co/Zn/Cd) transporter